MKSFLFAAYVIGTGFMCAASAHAATPGVERDLIVVGQSAAFSGSAAPLGESIRDGANLYFEEVNRSGGVHGRRILLLSLDDSYGPDRAIANTREFVEDYGVFALFGYVGTQTSNAVIPIVSEANVPFFGAFTGPEGMGYAVNGDLLDVLAGYESALFERSDDVAGEPWFNNLEGYLAAKAFVDALRRAGPNLTRAKFAQAALERDGDYLRYSTEGVFKPTLAVRDHDEDYLRFSTEGEFKPVLAAREQDQDYLRFSTDYAFVIVQERDEDYLRFSTDGEFVPIFGVVRAAR